MKVAWEEFVCVND